MAGKPKRILVAGLASLFAAGAIFGYAGCTEVQAAEERSERGGITLTDQECQIFDRLYNKIIQIASNGGSTSDMLSGKRMTLSWTYEELGLNGPSDISGSTEAVNALRSSLNKVRDALVAECPYELYWFDKTTGYSYSYCNPKRNTNTVSVEITNIKFAVAQSYQLNGDVNKVSAVKAVTAERTVSYADEIVAKYSSASDYEKLAGYKNEICALADYDDTITEESGTPYGDAWQIVYVFDRNPDTRVVCEAYAKAFQYLCDRTEFNDPEVQCRTVSGTMNGIIHMWNIVAMPDGENYIVDPTNCDEGTLLYSSGGVFLQGGTGDAVNGYQVMGYPYCYDENMITDYGIDSSALAIAPAAYVPKAGETNTVSGMLNSGNTAGTQDPSSEGASGSTDSTLPSEESDAQKNAQAQSADSKKNTVSKTSTAKTTRSTSGKTTLAPKTGDASGLLTWGVLLAAAGGAGAVLTAGRKRAD